jgi:anaerobic selenocysteine-containing dehydrogenase
MVEADGSAKYRDYADYIVRHERAPGIGLLAGWRGERGECEGKGAPNPQQLERYVENGGYWRAEVPGHARYFKMANRGYLEWAQRMGFLGKAEPVVLQLYSETLQRFRLAAQGHGECRPPARHRDRVATYFDPLPIWYEPFEGAQTPIGVREGSEKAPTPEGVGEGSEKTPAPHPFPLSAITQRPMFMYHAWGSQNAWLRQIATRNWLYLHPDTAAKYGIADEDWVVVESHHGGITVQAKLAANVQPDTVWTWNAIGKRKGAWRLARDAAEGNQAFLLNHIISDVTPKGDYANADPVTGQGAWFDLRVRIRKCEESDGSPRDRPCEPQFAPLDLGTAGSEPLRYGVRFRAANEREASK